MRKAFVVFGTLFFCATVLAQRPPRRALPSQSVQQAEMAVKGAMERFGNERKAIEVMLQVHAHIRSADRALVDPMQPAIAVQKAFEEMSEAERKNTDFLLEQGLIESRQQLDAARRSPSSADFGRLRGILREEAIGPSSRAVVRAATSLQQETMAWIALQELIAAHMKALAEVTGEGLRAAQEE
jgi:predicted naringenin-chalcone synthase